MSMMPMSTPAESGSSFPETPVSNDGDPVLVVGQFNVAQGVAISPFAVAFLVGYAVDIFLPFLTVCCRRSSGMAAIKVLTSHVQCEGLMRVVSQRIGGAFPEPLSRTLLNVIAD